MNRKIFITVLVIMLILTGCSEKREEPISDTQFVLGTVATVQLRDHTDEALLEASFDLLQSIEDQMSTSIEGSDVWNINANAGGGSVTVGEETYGLIEEALAYGALSEGRFDISMGPIVNLWGIGSADARLPSPEEIAEALSHVDYRNVILSDGAVSLDAGMAIDLGGIAKGYAADELAALLQKNRVTSAIINLGGNVKVIGSKEDGIDFRIGLQNPFDERNAYFGVVSLTDMSIVSSGDYERYFEQDGVRYHHIFDKDTGYPVVTDIAQVTVITPSSLKADALSTVFFSLPIDEGLALAATMEDVDLVYVTHDYGIYLSSSFKEHFELTDDSFTIMN